MLDEIETLQRVRSDVREKSLNALRQLIDEIYGGPLPGPVPRDHGHARLLRRAAGRTASRTAGAATGTRTSPPITRFDNPRAVQLRLPAFDFDRLVAVGTRVRDIYVAGPRGAARLRAHVDDAYRPDLAGAVTGELGGGVGIAPRIFLKKLVDVLDRVDQFPDFDPRRDYALTVGEGELTMEEREARVPRTADDIALDL